MISIVAMLSAAGTYGKKFMLEQGKIGDIIIDCTDLEEVEYSNQITKVPVESMRYVSDHIIVNPLRIRVEGSINNSPATIIGSVKDIVNTFQGDILSNVKNKIKGKSQSQITAYEVLTEMSRTRAIFDVVNYFDTFYNMAMESLKFSRDGKTGDRLCFTAELEQVSVAEVKVTSISSKVQKQLNGLTDKTNVYGTAEAPKAPVTDLTSSSSNDKLVNKVVGGTVNGLKSLLGW